MDTCAGPPSWRLLEGLPEMGGILSMELGALGSRSASARLWAWNTLTSLASVYPPLKWGQ